MSPRWGLRPQPKWCYQNFSLTGFYGNGKGSEIYDQSKEILQTVTERVGEGGEYCLKRQNEILKYYQEVFKR